MTKYMRSRHVPLDLEESSAVREEIDDFLEGVREVGLSLRELREQKKWTQKELGKKIGLDETHIAMLEEGGYPIPDVIAKRLAELFKTDHL